MLDVDHLGRVPAAVGHQVAAGFQDDPAAGGHADALQQLTEVVQVELRSVAERHADSAADVDDSQVQPVPGRGSPAEVQAPPQIGDVRGRVQVVADRVHVKAHDLHPVQPTGLLQHEGHVGLGNAELGGGTAHRQRTVDGDATRVDPQRHPHPSVERRGDQVHPAQLVPGSRR